MTPLFPPRIPRPRLQLRRLTARQLRVLAVLVVAAMLAIGVLLAVLTSGPAPDLLNTGSVNRATGAGSASGTALGAAISASASASAGVPTATRPGRGDDSVGDGAPDQPAVITKGERDPQQFALAFAAAWLNTTGKTTADWLDHLTDIGLTPQCADLLRDTDLTTVPPGRASGPVHVSSGGDQLTLVQVTVVSPDPSAVLRGTVTLTLDGHSSAWLVAGIDWQRA